MKPGIPLGLDPAEGRDQDRDSIGKTRNSDVGSRRGDAMGAITIAMVRLDEKPAHLSIPSGLQLRTLLHGK
jgi:hypothetical protein